MFFNKPRKENSEESMRELVSRVEIQCENNSLVLFIKDSKMQQKLAKELRLSDKVRCVHDEDAPFVLINCSTGSDQIVLSGDLYACVGLLNSSHLLTPARYLDLRQEIYQKTELSLSQADIDSEEYEPRSFSPSHSE